MISDVIEALALEGFDHDGKSYLRLSGESHPASAAETCARLNTYRQAAVPSGSAA